MRLATKHFGTIDIDEKGIIDFADGLPGFEEARKFILLGSGDGGSLFKWLQSVDMPELAFVVVDPFSVKKDYDIEISDEDMQSLGVNTAEDVKVYSIVVVPEDASRMSMNLKAPVIVNTAGKKGAQVILDTDRYGVRHYILEELRRQEDTGNARTDTKKGPVHNNK